ncbi:MAG: hypothetical protein WKF61_11550 [Luteimonas sp.]
MPWLFLLVALAAFAVAFKTSSVAVVVICLLVALGAVIMWVMGLLASRVGSRSRDESLMLNPDELRRMREQVEARRVAGQTPEPPLS